MRSRLLIVAAMTLALSAAAVHSSPAKDPPKKEVVKEGVYYEFRGHLYDRSTIAHNFTLYWSEGSQPINVTPATKIYRKGQPASLESVKSGDAVCGVGQVKSGKLIAVAVAFGDDGVELPAGAKVPHAAALPVVQGIDKKRR